MFAPLALAQEIQQSRGADARLDYQSLTRLGPWDDRNYNLTAEELQLLAPNEEDLQCGIPAFYRVELRRRFPGWMKTGPGQYPRSARQLFEIEYGGLMVDGVINSHRAEEGGDAAPVNAEIQLNEVLGANEITVEINPIFNNRVIAGANNLFGQEMYYSDDGGLTWTVQGTLPDTCCDPTVGWSSDGLTAYAAALSASIGVSFFRSTDFGETWSPALILTQTGSDKEFLHVDLSQQSPYLDNIYLTWHDGNVMQFARSRDRGLTFDPILALSDAPRGIGSDITTDSAGNIYYFYGAFSPDTALTLLKSRDGGDSWDAPVQVSETNGSFDWPIPSMETRRAWIYAACDTDRSGGAFHDSIYVAWTDTIAPESTVSTENHTQVKVARSRDYGLTWEVSIPHPVNDTLTVDRFNQWLTVDAGGVVHVVYYDTRNSVDRTGVDLYYSFSVDGGVTWSEPERVTSETSSNLEDGQEWGDYNGISVMFEKIIPSWTDNREGPPNQKDVYVADVVNVTAVPSFFLGANNLNQRTCVSGVLEDVTINVYPTQGFANPVTLTVSGAPSWLTSQLSVNPVAPGSSTTLSFEIGEGAAAGDYQLQLSATATDAPDKTLTMFLTLQDGASTPPVLLSPANGEPNAGFPDVVLDWQPVEDALEYRVQVSLSGGFTTTLFDEKTDATHFIVSGLEEDTTYFWRAATINSCTQGDFGGTFSFVAHQVPGQGSDECLSAPPVSEDVVATGTTVGATGTDITTCTTGDVADIWLKYTAPAAGTATFSLCGSDFDTSLAVFDACGGSQLACNDDSCDLSSRLTLPVVEGEDYLVRVAGWGGETGAYSLLVTRVANGGECTTNVLQDGGFEAGTPSSTWEEFSLNFGTPLCDTSGGCNLSVGTGPHTGQWWVWLGGISSADEYGYVEQTFTMPASDAATLSFYLEIPAAETNGFVRLSLDRTKLFEASETDQFTYATYTFVAVDVTAFADGLEHVLTIEGGSNAGGVFDAFVDDVCISVAGAEGEGEGEGEGETPVDCAGAAVRDNYGGLSGQNITMKYLDPAAGGTGGSLTFTFEALPSVDRIRISGSDGFLQTMAAIDPSELSISTTANGSPAASANAVEYTVTYEVESPAGSGTFVGGAPCKLVAAWEPPSCVVALDPPAPLNGATFKAVVTLNNARYDDGSDRFATLTSSSLGWFGDVALAPTTPGFGVSGAALIFDPAVTIANWSEMLNNGLYSTAVTGPGVNQTSECAERAGPNAPGVHTADQNENKRIELSELLRVIQFFNSGGLHCADNPGETEDGYVPGPGANQTCTPHSSDYAPRDWDVGLVELLRLIQFYNMNGYHYCPADGTEDGFCPGPAR